MQIQISFSIISSWFPLLSVFFNYSKFSNYFPDFPGQSVKLPTVEITNGSAINANTNILLNNFFIVSPPFCICLEMKPIIITILIILYISILIYIQKKVNI